jgi:Tol biopolymer transport system component
MRQTIRVFAIILLTFNLAKAQSELSAEVQLKAAIHKEQVEGDLKAAIQLYQRIVEKYPGNKEVAAKALLYTGQCYEKLGQADARKSYERLLRQYADQNEVVAEARARLSALERVGGLSHPSGMTLRKVWALERGWLEGSPSPDGRYHSFHDPETGDLALRDLATGQNRRLTNKGTRQESDEYAEGSVISGDGKQIAYAWYNKEKFCEIRVIGIDGSNPRTVFRDREFGHWLEPYQWTADGKQILANLLKNKDEGQLALIPVTGGPVRFLTSQYWWYANVSPDGRFLVYDVAGEKPDESDIWLLSLEGGQKVPLVRSTAADSEPVWMPDGKQVLFKSDRTGTNGFWTIDVVEGKPQGIPRLLKDGLGRVTRPNGFTRRGDFYFSTGTNIGEVYVTELDPVEGKMLRPPAPVAQRSAGSNVAPSWSPDGRRLAYYSLSVREGQRVATMVILSLETGEAREVPVKLDQLSSPVRWFPDGKSLLVSAWESPKRDQIVAIYRVDAQTGDHHLVRRPLGGGGARCEVSPDGKTLFFFSPGEPKLRGGVISYDIETGQERELARVPYFAGTGWARLAVSPDGRYLAFRSPVNEAQWTALHLLPAAGEELRELGRFLQSETEDVRELAWTPDGRNVLIVRRTGKDSMPELWRIPIAGGEPQRTGLSMESMGIVAPHPDGRRIAFESGNPNVEARELWVLENIPGATSSKTVAGGQ